MRLSPQANPRCAPAAINMAINALLRQSFVPMTAELAQEGGWEWDPDLKGCVCYTSKDFSAYYMVREYTLVVTDYYGETTEVSLDIELGATSCR